MRQRSNLIILFGIAFLMVGGAIVYLIVSDDDSSSLASGPDKMSILVAKDTIPANTVGADAIEQGLLGTKAVTVGSQPADALTSAAALENRIFAVEVEKGNPISTSQLATRSLSNIQVPDGYDAVALEVTYTNGGGGYIAPGDRVNVYGVYGDQAVIKDAGIDVPEGATSVVPRSELALTNVTVLDVSAQGTTSTQAATTATSDSAVTAGRPAPTGTLTYLLALKVEDVERVVHIASFADIYLSLTADDAPNAPDTPGTDGTSANRPVSAASVQEAA